MSYPVSSTATALLTGDPLQANDAAISRQIEDFYRHQADIPVTGRNSQLESYFNYLARWWKKDTAATSSVSILREHQAFQCLKAFGKPMLPFILRDLRSFQAYWFPLLEAIAGENPVPEEDLGDVDQMAGVWLAWAKAKGIEF